MRIPEDKRCKACDSEGLRTRQIVLRVQRIDVGILELVTLMTPESLTTGLRPHVFTSPLRATGDTFKVFIGPSRVLEGKPDFRCGFICAKSQNDDLIDSVNWPAAGSRGLCALLSAGIPVLEYISSRTCHPSAIP